MNNLAISLAIFVLGVSLTNNQAQEKNPNKDSENQGETAAIINSIPDIIFYKDINGVYRGGNEAWAKLIGRPLNELIGMDDFDIFPEDLAKFFRQKDREMLSAKATKRNEEWVQSASGEHVMLDTIKTPWVDDKGNILGVLGICRDITPPSDRDQEIRAANDQFYAAINAMLAGEIEPMNAIWSHSEDVSNQGPFGARMDGWDAVGKQFKREAEMKLGGRVTYKNLIVQAGRDLAYTVCIEEGENMTANGKAVRISHRATNIFRKEKGEWRLIHHHTDLSPQLGSTETE